MSGAPRDAEAERHQGFFFAGVFSTLVVFSIISSTSRFILTVTNASNFPLKHLWNCFFSTSCYCSKTYSSSPISYIFRKTGPLRDTEGPVLLQKCPLLPFPAQKDAIWMPFRDIWRTGDTVSSRLQGIAVRLSRSLCLPVDTNDF